jgi:hypothetical protein
MEQEQESIYYNELKLLSDRSFLLVNVKYLLVSHCLSHSDENSRLLEN